MEVLLIFLLAFWLLWIFRARIQVWLLSRILRRVQQRMQEGASAQQRSRPGYREQYGASSDGARQSSPNPEARQKQELDTIEARKFDRSSADEYVDFEELPGE